MSDLAKMTKEACADEMARYTLTFEEDDFKFYCDDSERESHIYMTAYTYQYGWQAAEAMLKELREKEKIE